MKMDLYLFLATSMLPALLLSCDNTIDVGCEPDCSGIECGADPVCGQSCGTCGDNAVCETGQCQCEFESCNDQCCAEGEFCRNERCLSPSDPCFDDTSCATQHRKCISSGEEAICGDCLEGYYDNQGQCDEDCTGRECGTNPNGQMNCGTCSGTTEFCSEEGQCQDDCEGRNCGTSPNEGFDCGACTGETEFCTEEGVCEDDCAGRVCGASPNEAFDCGVCSGVPVYCTNEGLCEDDCAGRVCGPSPHEGFDCGTCSVSGEICMVGQCAVPEWQDPPPLSEGYWQPAVDYCDSLTFDGHNDWRLPTVSELRTLIRGCPNTEPGGSCNIADDCLSYAYCNNDACSGCAWEQGPTNGCYWPAGLEGHCAHYWSSSTNADDNGWAWGIGFPNGQIGNYGKDGHRLYMRCVRPASP